MPKSDSNINSDMMQETGLVGPNGALLPSPVTWKHRLFAISMRAKIISVAILAVIAGFAALLTNIETIKRHFTPSPALPSVPSIVVEVTNSSKNTISVVTRGDFFLWLPGPGARHSIGKYEFRTLKNTQLESLVFTVKPTQKIRLLAHVIDQDLYGRILEKADCDIAFMVRKASGGFKTTNNLPFTKESIDKYFTSVDIGAD